MPTIIPTMIQLHKIDRIANNLFRAPPLVFSRKWNNADSIARKKRNSTGSTDHHHRHFKIFTVLSIIDSSVVFAAKEARSCDPINTNPTTKVDNK